MLEVIILCAIAIIVYIWYTNKKNTPAQPINKTEIIKTLIRQASRWSLAANQDSNSMIAVLHANYGAGYLWALRDIATDKEIEAATGIDVLKFRDEINKSQDTATKKMAALCPKYAPKASYLAKLAGDM